MKTALASLLVLLPALAAAHDYTYLDGGVVDAEGPRGSESDLGVRMSGSMRVAPAVAAFGSVVDAGSLSHLTAGAMLHTALNPYVDATAGAALELVDEGASDDAGVGLYAGLRWHIPTGNRRLELAPEVRHIDVLDESRTSLRNQLLYRVAPQLDIHGAVQVGDDDRVEAGVRYTFQPRTVTGP